MINEYVNDRFYIIDLIHRDRNESYIKIWGIMNDYEIGLMQTLMPLCLIVKLDHYLNQNQRFKKDKSGQQIIRNIIPPEENVDIWNTGWTAEINVREFAYQLANALYRKLDGDNYHQCHRNHLSRDELFKLLDYEVYAEEQQRTANISIHERELRRKHKDQAQELKVGKRVLDDKENQVVTINTSNFSIKKTMPLKDTRRLDLYINHSEWTTLALLNCTCLEFQSRHNEEYCYLTFKTRQCAPPPDYFSNLLEISHHHDEKKQKKKITKQRRIAFKDISSSSRRNNKWN